MLFYTLDVIISVGYRVKSKRGVEFRKWANSILKMYILEGYAINEKRLTTLNRTIEIQNEVLGSFVEFAGMEAKDVLQVIEYFSIALNLLDDYDHHSIVKTTGQKTIALLNEEEAQKIIANMDYYGK